MEQSGDKVQFVRRFSLKTCFMICVSFQLTIMMMLGPSLFDNGVQHYITDSANYTTESSNITNAPITTMYSPQSLDSDIPAFKGSIEKQASLFIQWYNVTCNEEKDNTFNGQRLCPCVPPGLKGRLSISTKALSWGEIDKANSDVKAGGEWSPTDCRNTETLAIIVPYRDREEHLRIFLNHMHPILRRQKISYRIFVVEQAFPEVFNKATMMNIGFLEAMKYSSFDCVIFHDVDMLLEDDRHMYRCSRNIRHMGANVNKFGYRLAYAGLIGGATAFKTEHFTQVNGFTNKFFGWGGEDDDMWQRINVQKKKVVRFPPAISRYTMIKHRRDVTNKVNPYSGLAWKSRPTEYLKDGLRSLKYKIHDTKLNSLYTWIYAEPVTPLQQFTSHWGLADEGTYAARRLCLVDCAAACAAQPNCKAFKTQKYLCKLSAIAVLSRRCQRFACDLIYIKNTYIEQLALSNKLNKFVEVLGICNEIGGKHVSRPLDLENCMNTCNHADDCLAFSHTPRPDTCFLSRCSVLQPSNTSTVFYKISPNVLKHYTRRTGDCLGGDIAGLYLSLEQCATKCLLLVHCAGFAFVNESAKSCWLKKTSCSSTQNVRGVIMYDRT